MADPGPTGGRPPATPETVLRIAIVLAVLLALTVVADLFVTHHGEGLKATPGFYAWFGILGAAAFVAIAVGLGRILRRPDDYYDR